MKLPVSPVTPTPSGIGHFCRDPAHSILPPRIRTTASGTGGAPVPSTSVAPVRARGGGGVPAGASKADVAAIFQPDDVFMKIRSERPECSSVPYATRYRYVP